MLQGRTIRAIAGAHRRCALRSDDTDAFSNYSGLIRASVLFERAFRLESRIRICGSPRGAIPWGHPAHSIPIRFPAPFWTSRNPAQNADRSPRPLLGPREHVVAVLVSRRSVLGRNEDPIAGEVLDLRGRDPEVVLPEITGICGHPTIMSEIPRATSALGGDRPTSAGWAACRCHQSRNPASRRARNCAPAPAAPARAHAGKGAGLGDAPEAPADLAQRALFGSPNGTSLRRN